MKFKKFILCFVVLLFGCSNNSQTNLEKQEVNFFVASSLGNAIDEIVTEYKKLNSNIDIVVNSESSGTLKTQIEEGFECDIFLSASPKQVNELKDKGIIDKSNITNLLENKVALIKPIDTETEVTSFSDVQKAKNIALAGEGVPAGMYAREIFENIGNLSQVMNIDINECSNVSSVLSAISEGSNEVGIVYATDANFAKDKVEVIEYASDIYLKEKVIYPVALINGKNSQNKNVLDFLNYIKSDSAIKIFEKYGFIGILN